VGRVWVVKRRVGMRYVRMSLFFVLSQRWIPGVSCEGSGGTQRLDEVLSVLLGIFMTHIPRFSKILLCLFRNSRPSQSLADPGK
jgi:hypothetical protein